jgi:hypothetical protein
MTILPVSAIERRPRWPWVMLGVGLVWTILIRVPLVVNAEDHLDSDLAVDGLTLLDAVNGHWRWHFPGTPHIGILPILLSYPQALIWGANPITLVSGGTVIWTLVVASTFWLAWKVFGLEVAGWAIVPLCFSSLGTIWLSGRITGGHLVCLVWHALAFVGLYVCLKQGGWACAALLGLWCGLGLYLDAMFAFTLAGLIPAVIFAWFRGGRYRVGLRLAAVFVAALLGGVAPREIGQLVDPYDAYPSQFALTTERGPLLDHVRLLGFRCLPRLISGSELNTFGEISAENDGGVSRLMAWVTGQTNIARMPEPREWVALLVLAVFLIGVSWLAFDAVWAKDLPRAVVGRGLLVSALLILGAFVVNRNIFNSDNYRYLVYLLTCWALGFGLLANDLARRGLSGRIVAWITTGIMLELMTSSAFYWYRNTRHYLDFKGKPIAVQAAPWSELMVWRPRQPGRANVRVFQVPSDVTHVFGGYWDVYRMAFLSKGQVIGIPYPMFPNRFPGWSRELGTDRGKLLVLQPRELGNWGGKSAADSPGEGRPTVLSASRIDWRPAFETVWKAAGRAPEDIDRLRVVVP